MSEYSNAKCENCRFFFGGGCRRYPPMLRAAAVDAWFQLPLPSYNQHPRVHPNGWCGEWRSSGVEPKADRMFQVEVGQADAIHPDMRNPGHIIVSTPTEEGE